MDQGPASKMCADIKEGMRSVLDVRASSELVRKFAALTGDCNPLHTDETFARKSIYRQPVVHGMLPLLFIGMLDLFGKGENSWRLTELSGQFLEPVFIDASLELAAEVVSVTGEGREVSLSYSVKNAESGAVVTRGAARVRAGEMEGGPDSLSTEGDESARMPLGSLADRELSLEEVERDRADQFQFAISRSSIQALHDLLLAGADGAERPQASVANERFLWPNLLAVMMVSTSAGMCIPGRWGTLLEFQAEINGKIDTHAKYAMESRVQHVSRSTRMVKTHFAIRRTGDEGEISASGEIRILVNQPPTGMPTIQELKRSGLDMGLRDKVVLVTGASRGIGETTAKLFGLFGSKVIVNYFQGRDDADRVVKEIVDEGGSAFAIRADVSDPGAVGEMVQQAVEKYGHIDILVNNAARNYRPTPFLELSWEEVQRDLDVIVKGAFNCCKAIIPRMLERGGGKIVNISSVVTDNPPANQAKYVTAKSALVGLTRSLAVEFAPKNIQVNLVVPNFVETDLVSYVPPAYRKKIGQETPMGRNASPIEVAQAVAFLASSFASFTTGQRFMVTGGALPYL